jgi:large subunit ribosomal protein L23
MDPYAVIKRPVITEKGSELMETGNTYVFQVADDSSKDDIRNAIQTIWGVTVKSVRTVNMPGKPKRFRFRQPGRTRSYKKAYVRLAPDEAIDELK